MHRTMQFTHPENSKYAFQISHRMIKDFMRSLILYQRLRSM
jgi:hypothetical protein